MAKNSTIEWTDHTWNPWRGCLKVSPGCKNCYMYRDQNRYGRDPSAIVRAAKPTFNAPLKYKEPAKVFTCSWSDFFIDDADEWREDAWDIIRKTPHLTYQILTKRPENILDRLPQDWQSGWANVWLGVSVETSQYLDRIEQLSHIRSKVRFVSYEPALEFVNFNQHMETIDWLIAGGESGFPPRKADVEWFRSVRDSCVDRNIPFFFKQHGGNRKIDGSWGGHLLDGKEWRKMPHDSK